MLFQPGIGHGTKFIQGLQWLYLLDGKSWIKEQTMASIVQTVQDWICRTGIPDLYGWVVPVHISNYTMVFDQRKIAQEQIWKYLPLEQATNQIIEQAIANRNNVAYKIVDSLFLGNTTTIFDSKLIVTDNIITGQQTYHKLQALYPEYWHVYLYQPMYQQRSAGWGYNCFMNRICPERARTFHELRHRNLLSKGLVSYNCLRPGNMATTPEDLAQYGNPYNNLTDSLEQSIIDSNISLVLETYCSDDHIAFSEKIFRVLQMPRPWLLYCSPWSVHYLRKHGFDVLDDYVDHSYDNDPMHHSRLTSLIDLLETFVDRQWTDSDHARFTQAAQHNQTLLSLFQSRWPDKLQQVLQEITKYD